MLAPSELGLEDEDNPHKETRGFVHSSSPHLQEFVISSLPSPMPTLSTSHPFTWSTATQQKHTTTVPEVKGAVFFSAIDTTLTDQPLNPR